MSNLIVIYDGQCDLCRRSITWCKKKLEFIALTFQDNDLEKFEISKEDAAKQVFVIEDQKKYTAADGIALLLNRRGNKVLSAVVTRSGFIGRAAYFWVANHRSAWPVKFFTIFLR